MGIVPKGRDTSLTYEVSGDYAMFADPLNKVGGELNSYMVPTYSALVGITESIYWKPSFRWVIDAVRVMNPIRKETKSVLLPELYAKKGGDRAYCSYLADVRYQVLAHFEFVEDRGYESDFDVRKHSDIATRSLAAGGRRAIALGKHDGTCYGYVAPAEFATGQGAYDELGELDFGPMLHSFTYPTKAAPSFSVSFWDCVMENGIITFPRPEECRMTRRIRDVNPNSLRPKLDDPFIPVKDELHLLTMEGGAAS